MKGMTYILAVLLVVVSFFGAASVALGANSTGYTLTWGFSEENVANVPPIVETNASAIAAGYYHSLAIVNGDVYAWGSADDGVTNVHAAARQGKTTRIAAGDIGSAAVADGKIYAWGSNGESQFTAGPDNVANTFIDVAVGIASETGLLGTMRTFGLGLTDEHKVMLWGTSFSGSGEILEWRNITAISAGKQFAMGLSNGCVLVAGAPAGSESYGVENVPAAAKTNITAISAGPFHCMALNKNGEVIVWGAHAPDEGTNITTQARALMPRTAFGDVTNVPPSAKSNIVEIAAGYDVCAARTKNGQVIIWGSELGTGGEIKHIPSYAQRNVKEIALGKQHVVVRSSYLPPEFVTTSLPQGYLETPYSASIQTLGDPSPTITLMNTNLYVPGIKLSKTGALSGTPTQLGTNQFWVVASNAYGMITNRFEIYVNPRKTKLPVFITTNLPAGQVGFPYSQQIEATESPVFALDEGYGEPLPDGLTLSADGLLSGIPTTEKWYYPQIVISNSVGSATNLFRIQMISPTNIPVISTAGPFPDAVLSTAYSNALAITGATNVTITAGSDLLNGLHIVGANPNWALVGTPTVQGDDHAFTITAENAAGSVSSDFTLSVQGSPVWQTPAGALPTAYLGQPYETVLWAKWGDNYVRTSGNLPAGLSMSTRARADGWTECVISGTPTVAAENSRLQLRAENAYDPSTLRTSRTFTLTVLAEEPPQYEYQFVSMSKSDTNLVLAWTNLLSEDTTAHLLSTTNLVTGWPTNNSSAWGSTVTSPATVPMPTAPAATFFLLWPPNSGN